MKINPYLMFRGQCEAAFNFYVKCLGGKIAFKITNGESPGANECSRERLDEILHARIEVGDFVLMGSDSPPERYDEPKGFFVSINIDTPAEAERIYAALSEKGTVFMPMGETFWAIRFGMFKDQFGIPWMINCEKKQ